MTVQQENDPPDRFLICFTLIDGSVHPLHLAIGPRVIGLCQPVLNAMRVTDHVEAYLAGINLVSVSGLICELDTIVSEYGVNPIWHGPEKTFEELPRGFPISLVDQLCHRELARSVNSSKEIQLPFSRLHLGDVDMEEANLVAFELLPFGLVAADVLKAGDPFAIGLEPMAPQWLIAAGRGEEPTCLNAGCWAAEHRGNRPREAESDAGKPRQ